MGVSIVYIRLHNWPKKTSPSQITDGYELNIHEGRHVIEKQLPVGEAYITNDIQLDREEQQIVMITGPNMVVNRLFYVRPP